MTNTESFRKNEQLHKSNIRSHNKPKIRSGTALSNNTHNYGSITDRFLPVNDGSPGRKLFYHQVAQTDLEQRSRSPVQINNNIVDINNWVQDSNSIPDSIETVDSLSSTDVSSSNPPAPNESKRKSHKEKVATALGINTERFLNFKTSKSPKKPKSLHNNEAFEHNASDLHRNTLNCGNKSKLDVNDSEVPEVPFKVLDAPGLRNDYYSNLVCWANKSDHIAAGLGSVVYVWSEKDGTIPLKPFGNQTISALSYSSDDYLAVGTKDSRIFIYSPDNVGIFTHIDLKTSTSICSIKWIPDSKHFFVGNDIGDITLIKLVLRVEKNILPRKYVGYLQLKLSFRCAQQQICGIDINTTNKQLAIGANSNCSTIWDISNLRSPKMLFYLKHEAAVKAVAFCPWMPNLLATGGGTRDKNIRFWHTTSGTLISKHKTKGQITAVVWSRSKKEILVAFGFGETGEKNNILAVYSYPSMKIKIKVNAPADLRILSADISNDFKSVCTSISDQSVRIYNVWDSAYDFKLGIYDSGIYGSDIIDSEEGVCKSLDSIR